mmetsp:Transcript_63072/g.137031  ORF Transcript_63072/g.137031 Transcript_63072/m.137031 type:complete len:837 (-) Transcript_63072:294-2804(-)
MAATGWGCLEPDYYALIGVERNATLHEIRSKFRQQVLAQHPDKGGDPKKFQLLNKAYNVLTDPEKRKRFDATGRTEKSAEEEFVEGFGGGRLGQRPKDADDRAVVNLQDRIITGPQAHEDGFQEWLRQRDQSEMVLTDKDFMKTALFNAAELSTQIKHSGPIQHVLGSPTNSYGQALGGTVQVQVKPRPMKRAIDHDEILVRMLAVPVEDSMLYAELDKAGVCLGMTGVGRIEQLGARVEELRPEDMVLLLPKPTKYSSQRPIGTARTLLACSEEDVIKLPDSILEELTPEQICLAPAIVCGYILLESYGSRLKPGESVLLNAAHLSAGGSALLQLCKLLKLKPLCLLSLPGMPVAVVKGEYGSKAAWQDAEVPPAAPAAVRAKYERISEMLITLGAEEVFPDAAALLRWRDRNQRMLPKLALDGVSSRDSCEQLLHCLQPGDKDSQLVVYGFGTAQPLSISPPLLSAWGGSLAGFNIARWVHSLSANTKKMMSVMENVTKLVRANKFTLDTVLYKVGQDPIAEAFSRAADAADSAQVVLTFPTLQEELSASSEQLTRQKELQEQAKEKELKRKAEEEEREKLKNEWLSVLFGEKSIAAMSPEGPLPIGFEGGRRNPSSLLVWLGDSPKSDNAALKTLPAGSSGVLSLSWSEHSAGEALLAVDLNAPQVTDGSWYLRKQSAFENVDLDLLHDVEILGRSMVETIEPKLGEYGLDWKDVVILGFGKGAGIALYAALLRLIPKPVAAMVFFSPVVLFPAVLEEKMQALKRGSSAMKLFTIWGSRDRATPNAYRQLLAQTLRKAPDLYTTPDTLPDGGHEFDQKSLDLLESVLPLCFSR